MLDLTIPINSIPRYIEQLDANLHAFIAEALHISEDDVRHYRIHKKSVDARNKSQIKILYKIELNPPPLPNMPVYPIKIEEKSKGKEVLIVGAGPAGLLAGYLLALSGTKVKLIERGKCVEDRSIDIEKIHCNAQINPESNYLFGEGGAGTYSDGKLYTRIKDPRCDFILDLFAEMGAPFEITWLQRPHIGSDILPQMVSNLRKEIIRLGGEIQFNACCKHVELDVNNRCKAITLTTGERIACSEIIFAIGHSAYDTIQHLIDLKVDHCLKSFQIGSRVEHPQDFVNRMQYGTADRNPHLPVPEYSLLSRGEQHNLNNVTSFCMCPGGDIIPGTQFEDRLSTNGMSCYKRNHPFANAAMIVSLMPENFKSVKEAFAYIEHIEKNAAYRGGGHLMAPAQDLRSFIYQKNGLSYADKTSYDLGLTAARLDLIHTKKVKESLQFAFKYFDRIAPGFIECGKIIGVETRVSSPVRFLRSENTLASTSHPNIWIAGEGAGCAGGIISAAVDGLKCAEAILNA